MICLKMYDDQSNILPWWSNFRKSITGRGATLAEYEAFRDKELEKYGARKVENLFNSYLEFENEKDATFFLLKWS